MRFGRGDDFVKISKGTYKVLFYLVVGIIFVVIMLPKSSGSEHGVTAVKKKQTSQVFNGKKRSDVTVERNEMMQTFKKNTEQQTSKCYFIPQKTQNIVPFMKGVSIPEYPTVEFDVSWLKPVAARYGKAVEKIPEVLKNRYTLDGKISVIDYYFDQAYLGGKAMVNNWSKEVKRIVKKDIIYDSI
jgi:hypothetical protein